MLEGRAWVRWCSTAEQVGGDFGGEVTDPAGSKPEGETRACHPAQPGQGHHKSCFPSGHLWWWCDAEVGEHAGGSDATAHHESEPVGQHGPTCACPKVCVPRLPNDFHPTVVKARSRRSRHAKLRLRAVRWVVEGMAKCQLTKRRGMARLRVT